MKKIEFDGYELWSTDGYTHNHVAYFARELDAETVRRNDHYMGVSPKKTTFIVFESVDEYHMHKNEEARKTALAKLTPAERIILGL